MSGNIEGERVNHVWETKIIMLMMGSPWLADNPKCHKKKNVLVQNVSTVPKHKMLKHRNKYELDNLSKH